MNPKDIPPDDLDDVILGRMIKEAGMFYKMELGVEIKNSTLNGNPKSGTVSIVFTSYQNMQSSEQR